MKFTLSTNGIEEEVEEVCEEKMQGTCTALRKIEENVEKGRLSNKKKDILKQQYSLRR